jgi:non-ribosomal peptide synthetase component F
MLPRDLLEGVKTLGAQEGVTLFMALLATFQALLAYHTGEKRIVVGTDVANRPTLDTEGMIGFFINLLPLSTDLSGDPRFLELLQRVRETTLAAYTYQDLPFHKLVEELRPERSLSHNPLVQVLFVMQNTPPAKKVFSGLSLSRFDLPITHSKFDVAVFVNEDADGLQCHWLYSRDLFEQSTIARMATHFENLLRSAIANPHLRLSALEVLGAEEKERGRVAKMERKQMQLKKLLTADPQPASFVDDTAVRG